MAIIHTKQAGASLTVRRFGGIDRSCASGNDGGSCTMYDLDNLRVGRDGVLRRRNGFRHLLTLPAAIRGIWSGIFCGERSAFAAAGAKLYRLDLDAGEYTEIGDLAQGESKVTLFLRQNQLFCLDGESILCYDGSVLRAVEPYIPMVCFERGIVPDGTVYEPINLIGRQVRFSFLAPGNSPFFLFGYRIASVDRGLSTESNGEVTDWTLAEGENGEQYLAFSGSPEKGAVITVTATLDSSYFRYADVASCTGAAVWGSTQDSRILCWGGGMQGEIFTSRAVSDAQLTLQQQQCGTGGELYFPQSGAVCLGEGKYAVRAVCPQYERLLIFTDGECWSSDLAEDGTQEISVLPINSGVGCTADGGAVLAGNDPLTVCDGAVWRWSTSALRRDECSAERISDAVADLIGGDFSTDAVVFCARPQEEIWMADPHSAAGEVFVFHTGLSVWYRFTGVFTDGFFAWRDEVAFWQGAQVYCFDQTLMRDEDEHEVREIPFSLTLEGLDFGDGARLHHLTRAALHFRGKYPAMSMCFRTDRGRQTVRDISAGGEDGQDHFIDRAVTSGRFRLLQMTLAGTGETAPEIRGLVLCAEPGGRN